MIKPTQEVKRLNEALIQGDCNICRKVKEFFSLIHCLLLK